MTKRGPDEYATTALALWKVMTANDRLAVRIGMFPADLMSAAEQDGFESKELATVLMRIERVYHTPSLESAKARVRFPLGKLVATPGALDLFERTQQSAEPFLVRHARGDWGDLDLEDKVTNDSAVLRGTRILSAYHLGGEKFWIITEADRSSTCLLLPSEY